MDAEKKPKIKASDVEVGNRTLEAVLADLAERSVRAEERVAEAAVRSARAEEIAARAQMEATMALKTISALLQDFRTFAGRTELRFEALEKAIGA